MGERKKPIAVSPYHFNKAKTVSFGGKPEMTTYGGSFENEALKRRVKTVAPSTQISKTKHPKLETTVGRRITTLSLA